ncbi:MAG TPA: FAD-dependent oxidoreductase [Polyangiaceae bacterium]|nr:FAD-dependent oxidoreductase [Polyangiaceae bacterium]
MARTALFSRLERVVSSLFGGGAERGSESRPGAAGGLTRRQLLEASAGLGVCACARDIQTTPLPDQPAARRVAVIGAGLAGLHCAFRLAQAGVDVTVYEANTRIGGRTYTGRKLFGPNVKLIAELGGEFIASDHSGMLALAREFGVMLDERPSADAGGIAEVYWLGGKEIPPQTVNEQLAATTPKMAASLSAADRDPSVFRDLDNTTLADFFEQSVPSQDFPELSSLLNLAFRGEFGLELDQQSALNVLYLIGPGVRRGLNASSSSSSLFHAHAGNDSFATQLSERLGARVKVSSRLSSIRPIVKSSATGSSPAFQLAFETDTASGFVAEAEHVVFALPFSVLRKIDLGALELSDEKRKLINELGYGTHSKLLGAFLTRVWRDQLRSGSVSSDLPFQQVWDSSVGQTDAQSAPSTQGILSNLLGGIAGAKANATEVAASMTALLSDLNGVFVGLSAAYLAGSAVRMHWPSSALFRGSVACYRPGQWALRGNEGRREGNLYFCGEHCSVDYQGRMEGAVETGALVAARILDELMLPWPSALGVLLEPKLAVQQPCYDGTTGAALGFLERREKLAP